jgi:opacity protein-like surface antigen
MRHRARHLGAALAALTFLLVAHAPDARAGEEELVVAPSLAYSVIRVGDGNRHGGAVYLDVDYGLTDSWALRGTGRYAAHYLAGDDGGLLSVGGLGFGVLYTFDVLKVVPFASLTAGASALGGAAEGLRWNFDLSLGLGFDYLVSRSFSVGFEIRYQLLVPDIMRNPFFLGIGVRLAWRRQ